MILVGDIGGTHSRLAFMKAANQPHEPVAYQRYPSRSYANLDEIVRVFVGAHDLEITQACFGVAGPVQHGRCTATNLAWVVDAQQLAEVVGLDTVWLINDLEAIAYGIAALGANDTVTLNPGAADAQGNAVVIAAGTGLGEAGLYWDGRHHWPFATEGGHASFSPHDTLQVELLQYLLTRFKRVSWERVLSGPGLQNIYAFFGDTGRSEEPAWLREEMQQHDPAAVISRTALEGKAEICVHTLDLFVSLYGAEAGNMGLKVMARGGVFVGGGIAPQIIDKLQAPAFMQAFTAKGRMQPLLEAMPVRVIMNDQTALLGAVRCAELRASTDSKQSRDHRTA
jgi:glucokinase